jgi:acyl CoA:acetate/3-ketoacid CoA transferase beta subunit
MPEYTDRELMVIAAEREIRDGNLVFAGMRLPGGCGPDIASLASWDPGRSVEAVRAATGWDLRVADGCRQWAIPTAAELEIVRACDPAGFWTR